MRFKVPITVGDPLLDSHYCVICYNNNLRSFVAFFYQRDEGGEIFPIRNETSRRLNDVLGEAIDWVEENLEIIRFRKADEARDGQAG